jgi:hypothetical protein
LVERRCGCLLLLIICYSLSSLGLPSAASMRRHLRSSVLHGDANDGGDGSLIAVAWRLIRCELLGSRVLVGALDLIGLSFCPPSFLSALALMIDSPAEIL